MARAGKTVRAGIRYGFELALRAAQVALLVAPFALVALLLLPALVDEGATAALAGLDALARIATWLAVTWLLWGELGGVRAEAARLREPDAQVPPPTGWARHPYWTAFVVVVFAQVATIPLMLLSGSPWLPRVRPMLFAVLPVGLFLSLVAAWRGWRAAHRRRAAASGERPRSRSRVVPGSVLAFAAAGLVFLQLGLGPFLRGSALLALAAVVLSSRVVVALVSALALLLASLPSLPALPSPAPPGRIPERPDTGRDVELLVELRRDDPGVLALPVLVSRSEAGRAFPQVGVADDPQLARTWVVRVPTPWQRWTEAWLRGSAHEVADVRLNTAAALPLRPQTGRCEPGGAGPVTDDPLAGGQWALATSRAGALLDRMPAAPPAGRPQRVAILDTGVDGGHEDLADALRGRQRGDRLGHGTTVAGQAAAVANNRRGIASLNLRSAWVELWSYPMMAGPRPSADDVAAAIVDATDDGADVVVMAFGGAGDAPRAVRGAVERAARRGVLLVAAAGNDGRGQATWPASLPQVLAVGAHDRWGATASFSNDVALDAPAVLGPGVDVCTTTTGGGYALQSGTSIAAGFVGGVGAVVRGFCPRMTGPEVAALLDASQRSRPGAPLSAFDVQRAIDAARADRRCR